MEVLERSLDEERCLCGRMREEDEKFWYNDGQESHKVVPILARAVPRFWNFEGWAGTGAKLLDVLGSIFFRFLESFMDNCLQNNKNQTK